MTSSNPRFPQTAPPSAPLGQAPEEEISLLDLWRILMDQKWMIVLVTLLVTSGAIVYALLATPVFQTNVLLEFAGEDAKKGGGALAQLGGLAAMAGISVGGGGTSKDAAIAKLRSRIFIQEFIQDDNLLPILFEKSWDQNTKNWIVEDPTKIPTYQQGVEIFLKSILKVNEDKKTGLITLTMEWKNAAQVTRWANLLVERINRHLRTLAIEEAKRNIDYLNNELAKTTFVELKQVIATLLEDQIKKIMLANGRPEYAFKILDPAVVPERRISPKRALIAMLGGVLGGFLGVALAFLRHRIQQSRNTPPGIVAPTRHSLKKEPMIDSQG
ncbi:MAG: hypothetical protein HQL95_03190 [Magnetococcales bacterium]|nr:hypothetical protein [Magnetococcales bacterium]